MEISRRTLETLTLDARNARRHGSSNLAAIGRSLSEFGQRRPVVIRADGTILAGNGLVRAARDLGWTDVDVTVVPDEWTDEQAVAFAIADNRAGDLSEWDDSALLESLEMLDGDALLEAAGYSIADLDDLRLDLEESGEWTEPEEPERTAQGERYIGSKADYAERYAAKTTRLIEMIYPNDVYVWAIEILAAERQRRGATSNSEVVIRILEEISGQEAPEWT